jgi:alpha-tubulin suppressor-like RCC1 family protein
MARGRGRAVVHALVGVLALVGAGCGGDDDDSVAASTTAAPPSTTTSTAVTSTTVEVEGLEAAHLAAGDQHACSVDADGVASCWGYNRMGQLGDDRAGTDASTPVHVAGSLRFTSVSAGRYFSCGLTAEGQAWCWGDNGEGALGDGTTGGGGASANKAHPVQVLGGLTFAEITTGQLHACGRTAAGVVHCWGAYAAGQLGNGSAEDQVQPSVSAAGIAFDSIDASGTNTCGIDGDGAAWCWGSNNAGQLGNGTKTNARQPVPGKVNGPVRFTALAVSRVHVCGLDADGAAWCWGGNSHGQLGDGTTAERFAPAKVAGGQVFASLSGGLEHTCGVTDDGDAYCWGANASGQVGDGSDHEDRSTPVLVTGGLKLREIAAGEEYTCGIDVDGLAHCWGANVAGGLGAGLDRGSPVPVLVRPAA